jgi:hypothetical protein
MDRTHVQLKTWYSRPHKNMLIMWRQLTTRTKLKTIQCCKLDTCCLHMTSILLWSREYHVANWTCVQSMFLAW